MHSNRSAINFHANLCGITNDDGSDCLAPVPYGAPLNLCDGHMRMAHQWVADQIGPGLILLPEPCPRCGNKTAQKFPETWICQLCQYQEGDPIYSIAQRRVVEAVYYIRFGDRIKIGTTGNLYTRLSVLPHDELLALELGGRTKERERHRQFADFRIGTTEWFTSNPSLTGHIAKLRAGVEDPRKQYAYWLKRESA